MNVTPRNLRRDVEASLQRLQTHYLDVYLLHWPARYTPQVRAHAAGAPIQNGELTGFNCARLVDGQFVSKHTVARDPRTFYVSASSGVVGVPPALLHASVDGRLEARCGCVAGELGAESDVRHGCGEVDVLPRPRHLRPDRPDHG